MSVSVFSKTVRHPLFVVFAYALFGFLWITFSDLILSNLVKDMEVLNVIQTWKGWFYILLTSILLYILIKRNIEENLKQASANRNFILSTPIPLVIIEESGIINAVNDFFTAAFGYTHTDIPSVADWWTLAYPDEEYRSYVQGQWASVEQSEEGLAKVDKGRVFTITTKAGDKRDVRFFILEEEKSFIILCVDITKERMLEKQLRHAEKMNALGKLAGGIAHDFNNQLSVISGFSDIIAAQKDNPHKVDTAINAIRVAIQHSTELTSQLLLFSRNEKEKMKKLDINNTIKEVLAIIAHTFPKKIILENNIHPDPLLCLGEPSSLLNAVLNLAINARDSLNDNRGTITIKTTLEEEKIKIIITDSGSGIDPEVLPHIFEPFYTTKEKDKGTGMGLAAVYAAVDNHGGSIAVDSTPQKGSTFTITLPLFIK